MRTSTLDPWCILGLCFDVARHPVSRHVIDLLRKNIHKLGFDVAWANAQR